MHNQITTRAYRFFFFFFCFHSTALHCQLAKNVGGKWDWAREINYRSLFLHIINSNHVHLVCTIRSIRLPAGVRAYEREHTNQRQCWTWIGRFAFDGVVRNLFSIVRAKKRIRNSRRHFSTVVRASCCLGYKFKLFFVLLFASLLWCGTEWDI